MGTPTYTTTVNVIDVVGGAYTQVTARLWMMWTEVGGPGSGDKQQEAGSQTYTASGSFPISFLGPADFSYASRFVGLSLQDSDRVADDEGWWFRSEAYPTTLPASPIEIILAPAVLRTAAELQAMLPALPLIIESDAAGTPITSVTSASVTPKDDGTIDLIAAGTTSRSPLVAPVGFTYALTFRILPSASLARASSEVFIIGAQNRGSITFTGTGSAISAIEAAVLNALSDFVEREIFPMFRSRLEASINSGVLSSIANLVSPGNTILPAGIVVSARSVLTRSGGLSMRAALGAYGGVLNKFPTAGGGGGTSSCPLKTSALFVPALNLSAFRMMRDSVLAETPLGRALVELYYRHGEEVVQLMQSRPDVAGALFELLPEMGQGLAAADLSASLRQRFEGTLRLIAQAGSPALRDDIAWAIAVVPWPADAHNA